MEMPISYTVEGVESKVRPIFGGFLDYGLGLGSGFMRLLQRVVALSPKSESSGASSPFSLQLTESIQPHLLKSRTRREHTCKDRTPSCKGCRGQGVLA